MDFEAIKQDIKDRIPISELISQYVTLNRSGSSIVGLCPFHTEKTPSFNVNDDKGFYKCFGCGKSGDIFTFLMDKENYSFMEAMKFLGKMAGVEVEAKEKLTPLDKKKNEYYDLYKRVAVSFTNILLNKEEASIARKYLATRNLTLETIQDFQLGYLPDKGSWLWDFLKKKNYSDQFLNESGLFSRKHNHFCLFSGRLVFPILDKFNRVIAFSGRQLKDFGPKYINSPETLIYHKSDALFGIHKAQTEIRRKESVYLVEGNFDVLSMHQSGITNCVAPLGTAFTEKQALSLTQYIKKAFCLFDSDAAGIKASEKTVFIFQKLNINSYVIELPQGADPSDILKNHGAEGLNKIVKLFINSFDYLVNKAISVFGKSTIEEKELVIKQLLPFIQLFTSEVKKNESLRFLAQNLSIDFISLQKDIIKDSYKQNNSRNHSRQTKNSRQSLLPDRELLLLVAASVKVEYYIEVRKFLSEKDFQSVMGKEFFIAMEDSYRHETFFSDNILERIETVDYRDQIAIWIKNPHFIQDPQKTLIDTIQGLKIEKLVAKKKEYISFLSSQNYQLQVDSLDLDEILEEILILDQEIMKLKGEV